jgi:DNA replication protein DnaC
VHARAAFDNYVVGFASQDAAKKTGVGFATAYKKAQPNKGFILSGPVGTGKTHLLCAALGHLMLEVGVPVHYVEISLLYATIRRGFQENKSGGEIIDPLSKVDVLAIDELGKGRGSPFELETLEELIARRYNAGRTTLFATNYPLAPERRSVRAATHRSSEELKSAGKEPELLRERVGERIYSRLCEMCEFVELAQDLPDHRRTRQEIGRGRAVSKGAL